VRYLPGKGAYPLRKRASIHGYEEMSAADPAKAEFRTDRSERNILLALSLVAAAEVCVHGPVAVIQRAAEPTDRLWFMCRVGFAVLAV
jgi:hypothetical protein